MPEQFGYIESFKATREAQQKFDYFYLGVVLATLALSIQTFSTTPIHCYRYLLLVSWGLWLVSFVAGFFRIERTLGFLSIETSYLQYKAQQDNFSKALSGEIQVFKALKESWSTDELKEELGKIDSILELSDKLKKARIKHTRIAYQISKWSYFIGIVSYVLFRGINLFFSSTVQN